MEYTTLRGTGLRVSVAGLGCGGHSRLGRSYGVDEADSVALVRHALDLGISFIDTAEAYGTEDIVGKAIAGRRDEVVLSTKAWIVSRGGQARSAADIGRALDGSLARLGTDHVDVYHLHGVPPGDGYDRARDELLPCLLALKEQGKIGHAGITEGFGRDTAHRMFQTGLTDGWEVAMVGFNLLNQSGRERVLEPALAKGVGTLIMFAVRRALSGAEAASAAVAQLRESGLVDAELNERDPLDFLVRDGVASSLTEAAYRFCRHTPGADVVLTGTGKVEHLEENVRSILGPPLPSAVVDRLATAFGRVDTVSGN
jgi:aryl-alcohol dehydrogenase-like predicted oxidoreductase